MATRALLLALLLVLAARAEPAGLSDPLPLRRVVLPPERLLGELKRVEDRTLVRMPRAAFEKLVQAAARAVRDRAAPPRLIEAHYRATLTDGPSLTGTAQWKVRHTGDGPALLRLAADAAAINLAIRSPRYENREAILTDFPLKPDGSSPALLVDQPGDHTVTLDWSARVEARPEGLQVELRMPDCPAARLELSLPADRGLVALQEGVLIHGPRPADDADRRTWVVACGGRAAVPLLIRRSVAGRPAVLLVRQRAVQRLSPERLDATHTFQVEALHQDVRELVLRHDPALRPVEVTAAELESWEGKDGTIRVRLGQPAREASVEVKCLGPGAARSGPAAWTSPGMSVQGAVPGRPAETLELWLHPRLRIGAWRPGDFRLTGSKLSDEDDETGRHLTLVGGGVGTGTNGAVRRPSLDVQADAASFHTRQQVLWALDADGMEAVAQVAYTVRQGALFDLRLQLPAGWDAETVDLSPPDLLRGWGVRREGSAAVLSVGLRRPIQADAPSTTLSVRLRPVKAGRPTSAAVPFPDLVPLGGRYREGGLAIDYDNQAYFAAVRTGARPGELPAEGPWGQRVPDLYYPFRGEAVTGTLRLTPRPPLLRARARLDAYVSDGVVRYDARLLLEAEGGRPGGVDVFVPGPPGPEWRWTVEPGGRPPHRIERLPAQEVAAGLAALAARTPLELAALRAASPPGTRWRVSLDRPITPRRPVTLRASRFLDADGPASRPRWKVPLPVVLGVHRFEGEATVHLAGPELVTVEAAGLAENLVPRPTADVVAPWRSFRYGGPFARLTLLGGSRSTQAAEGLIDRARLTTLMAERLLRHDFAFTVGRWPERTLPVQLPPGAQLVAVRVDGHWLDRAAPTDDGTIELPVLAGGRSPRYVIRYTTPAAGGPWSRQEALAPVLPRTPAAFERRWLLPPGVRPLLDSAAQPLPGHAKETGPPLRYPTDVLRLGPVLPLFPRPKPPHRGAERALNEADAGLRNSHAGDSLSLERLVEELAFGYLRDQHPLVIDAAALREVGLGASDEVNVPAPDEDTVPPWEQFGLVAVPGRSAVLLTRATADADDAAAALAVRHGRDPSGRFVTALEWLHGSPGAGDGGPPRKGWTPWAPVAGEGPDTVLTVVHSPTITALGVLMSGLLVLVLLALRDRPLGTRVRWLVGWLVPAGLALAWLPTSLLDLARWPLLTGLAVGVPLLFLASPRARHAPSTAGPHHGLEPPSTAALTVLALLLLALGRPATAQEEPPEVVYLVDVGGEPSVLVSPAVVRRLEAMARADGGPGTGAVLVRARYEGRVADGSAEVDATFHLHSFSDERAELTLPLDGVRLVGDVMLNGARVLPRAVARPRGGGTDYRVAVKGQGGHKIELRFRVPVTALGEEAAGERQVRFGVPRLLQSQLVFRGPAGAAHLFAVSKHGGQRVRAEGGVPVLEADLGAPAAGALIRWHEAKPARTAKQSFREAYEWDLRPEGGVLRAWLRYTLTGGAARALAVDVPAELEVRSAQARRPRGSSDPAVRLSDWSLAAGGRRLNLAFPGPVSGEVEVELLLVPRVPLPGLTLLPLPRPQGESAAGPGYLAYRATGLEAALAGSQGLAGIVAGRFMGDWPEASRPSVDALAAAFTFRRDAGLPPQLRLGLRPRPEPYTAKQTVRYTVGPRQAELSARLELTAPGGDLAVVAWDLGPGRNVILTDVKGPAVSRWAQSGSRLLLWLAKATDRATVDLTGWAPVGVEGKQPRFDLPGLRPVAAAGVQTRVELTAAPDFTLREENVRQLALEGTPTPRSRTYAGREAYGGAFRLVAEPPPTVRIVTRARLDRGTVAFESRLDFSSRAGLATVVARLRDWPGDAQLDADLPAVTGRREQQRRGPDGRERSWTVDVRPGVNALTLTLRGRAALEEAGGAVAVPDVQAATPAERVVVIEPTLAAEPTAGMVRVAPPADAPKGSEAWRLPADDWSMRLVPRRAPGSAPAAVLFSEVTASLPDGRRWLHEVVWWLRQDATAELAVTLPGPGSVVSVTIDGRPAAAASPGSGKLWLPLSGPPGVRCVHLRYRRDEGREPLPRPDLTPPKLEGVSAGPTLWTVAVPSGWSLAGASKAPLTTANLQRAVRELHRASVDVQAKQKAALEQRLRIAELALEGVPADARKLGPDGDLGDWLKRLRKQADALPREEGAALHSPEEPPGSPVCWLTDGTGPPLVRLSPASGGRPEQAVGATLLWLVLWLLVWMISVSPALRTAARWLWPEAVAGAGMLSGWLVGPTAAVAVLVVVGVLSRVVIVYRAVRRWWMPGR